MKKFLGVIQIAKTILISFKDIEKERLFGEIMKTLSKYGIVLHEYEDTKEIIEIVFTASPK